MRRQGSLKLKVKLEESHISPTTGFKCRPPAKPDSLF
jgi:hypothetical protein